jgi:phosphate-selective porin
MIRRRFVLAFLLLLLGATGAWAQAASTDAKAAAVPVVKQLEAFRRDDFDTAFTFASGTIRERFDRRNFEAMVRRGYPEIAQSTFAAVTKTELESPGLAYVTVKIRGANGQSIEALYEMVWEDDWKINGVATRPDASII